MPDNTHLRIACTTIIRNNNSLCELFLLQNQIRVSDRRYFFRYFFMNKWSRIPDTIQLLYFSKFEMQSIICFVFDLIRNPIIILHEIILQFLCSIYYLIFKYINLLIWEYIIFLICIYINLFACKSIIKNVNIYVTSLSIIYIYRICNIIIS